LLCPISRSVSVALAYVFLNVGLEFGDLVNVGFGVQLEVALVVDLLAESLQTAL